LNPYETPYSASGEFHQRAYSRPLSHAGKEEGVVTKRDELEKRERDRELEENMREVEEEMRREEKEKESTLRVV